MLGRRRGRCNAGGLALWRGCQVVYVEEDVRRPSWSNISAAIDGDPYFSKGQKPSQDTRFSAWHVVRVHNFCRVFGANEAACERVGSRMKAYWEDHRHPSITRLMDSVVLQDAEFHLLGSARDEYVIRAVGDALLSLGMRPCVTKRWWRRRHGCEKPKETRSHAMDRILRQSEDAARQGGRDVDTFALPLASSEEESSDEGEKEASEKLDFFTTYSSLTKLNKDMAKLSRESRPEIRGGKHLQETCEKIKRGSRIACLEFHPGEKEQTPSVANAALLKWLEGAEGRAWLDKRKKRLR